MDPEVLLSHLPDPVILVDAGARLVWGNRAAEDALGWTLEEVRGEPVDFLCHPDDLPTALASLASVQRKELGTAIDIRVRHRDGTYGSYEVRGRNALDVEGVEAVVLGLRHVGDRAGWEVARGDDRLYRSIVDRAPAITMVLDGQGRLRGASRALTTLVGRDLESSLGHHLREFVTQADGLTLEAELALAMSEPGQRSLEVMFTTQDGTRTVPMSLTMVNLLDDRAVQGLVVSAVDITALHESRARLQHLANHDPLTDLPNRSALTDRLHDALGMARRRSSTVSLIYCDLDGFKAVNDGHGHLAGDAALKEVANRLLAAARAGDTVARMGGDEFVILVEDGPPDALVALVERIHRSMERPLVLTDGEEVQLGLTLGAATADGSGSVDELLGRADAAMYEAKRGPAESGA